MAYRILTPLLLGLLAGCELIPKPPSPPLPPSEKVRWEGRPPERFLTDSTGTVRLHTLDFRGPDSLRLRLTEYASDVLAFQAFQSKASSEELRQGYFRDRNSQVFVHGPFVGELQLSRGGLLPASFLKERLTFPGEELFQKPKAFQTFPIAGQISGSERVLTPEIFGSRSSDVLVAMAYECHQDTALLFRGHPPFSSDPMDWITVKKGILDTSRWGRERHFSGVLEERVPLVLWIFQGEVAGVWGCYDEKLAQEYVEKLKKTAILSEKP